jgi:16S rRNA (cytosine1402-N4)-methyltransferase
VIAMSQSPLPTQHLPVLRDAVARAVAPDGAAPLSGWWLDGTLGGGGHAAAVLERLGPDGRLLGLDRDPAALERAQQRLAPFGSRAKFVHGSFADLDRIAAAQGITRFAGIVLDLGYSSDQLDDPLRGLSFQRSGPLDMRLDPQASTTAADLVNTWPADELADLIWRLGEDPRSRRIARAIVAARPLETTTQLADVIAGAAPPRPRGKRRHPATRTFQALRIAVNDELAALEQALPAAIDHLSPGGRLAVISFHSLEDRIVKRAMRAAASGCTCPTEMPICVCNPTPTVRLINRRPIAPEEAEIASNPRSRSALLRIAERLADASAGGAQ